MPPMPDLEALVRRSARRPACSASATSARRAPSAIDGDDAALVPHRGEYLVVCGEAISPPFLAEPTRTAPGAAAVVTNVSDVRAMGGRPLALVDMLVSPDREHAERVLDGIAWASDLLGVPVVGGHLTIGQPPGAVGLLHRRRQPPLRGRARARRRAARRLRARRPVHERHAAVLQRAPRPPRAQLRDDGEALVEVAEAGLCHAARDVSMPGIAGSLLQMIEGAGCGATLDLDRLPRPRHAARALAADVPELRLPARRPPEHVEAPRGLHAPRPRLRAVRRLRRHARAAPGRRRRGGRRWDLARSPLTGLGRAGSPSAGA